MEPSTSVASATTTTAPTPATTSGITLSAVAVGMPAPGATVATTVSIPEQSMSAATAAMEAAALAAAAELEHQQQQAMAAEAAAMTASLVAEVAAAAAATSNHESVFAASDPTTAAVMAASTSTAPAAPPTSKPTKTRSTNLTHEQKRLICLYAKQNPTSTQAQLGKWAKEQFGLASVPSQSSISHTLKRRQSFEHMKSEDWSSKRMRTVKYPELDTALANWFLYCQARQIRIQGDEIKAKAQTFFDLMNLQAAEPPQFSNGWLHSFQSRHGFSRSPNAHNADTEMISTREEFFEATRGFAPWDIYWMDETRLQFGLYPDDSVASDNQHLTLALCGNLDGSDLIDPFFVCPGQLDVDNSSVVAATASPVDFGFTYAYNKKVWMTPTIFREWLLAFDWKMHEENRHVLLIIDTFSSHQVKKMTLKNVTVRFVLQTPLGEHLLEPALHHIVSALKRRYRQRYVEFAVEHRGVHDPRQQTSHGASDSDSSEAQKFPATYVDAMQAVQWVLKSWREIPKTVVMEAFGSIGVVQEDYVSEDTIKDTANEGLLETVLAEWLKRLDIKSPMKMSDFVYPEAERLMDEDLTDQDFVDSALDASLSTTIAGKNVEPPRKIARLARSRKIGGAATAAVGRSANGIRAGIDKLHGRPSPHSGGSAEDLAGAVGVTPTIPEEEWQAWADSHRFRVDEVQALETVIRLASEMNCEPTTLLDLNRIQAELAQKRQSDRLGAIPAGMDQVAASDAKHSAGVCRFSFGAGATTI